MSIKDIIENSLKQSETSASLSPQYILVTAVVALVCSLAIFLVYKKFYRGAVYSQNFGILLIIMCLVTSFVITTISSSFVLSLGMVGALSIVRFRSAIKDPLDIGFLFWATATGIIIGAGLFPFALMTTLAMSLIYIAFYFVSSGISTYLLVIKYDEDAEKTVKEALKTVKNVLKSKSAYKGKIELTLQLKLKGNRTDFVQKLSDLEGVDSTMLIEYTGDYI